jgi:hypothetical protein
MIIANNLLEKMSAADRKQYGKMGWTAEESHDKESLKLERKLHAEFNGFLRRHEFDLVIHGDPRKKSQLPPGWPDYSIFKDAKVLFIEFKVNGNRLSDIQKIVTGLLLAQGFTVRVLHAYGEAVDETMRFFSL